MNSILPCHVFHHDDLEGQANAPTHHPSTYLILLQSFEHPLLVSNTTPRYTLSPLNNPSSVLENITLHYSTGHLENPPPLMVLMCWQEGYSP